MAFTNSDDVNILQASDSSVVGAGLGNDRYVLSAATLNNNQRLTISDSSGLNALQLVGGLVITSSQVTSNALLLNLNNGAQITLLGANTFNFITGGDPLTGAGGTTQNFNDFVTQSLRTTVPPGNTPNNGGTVTVNNNGGTTAGGGGNPVQSVTVAPAAASFNEGTNAVFNVSANNVPNGTGYTFQLSGIVAADVVGGALTGTVVINNGVGVISIPLAADTLTEGAETLVVTLTNTGLANAPSASAVVNDTSTAPTNSTYTLTGGVDTIGIGQTAGNSIGTANLNDLNAGDRIIDDNSGDNDTLNAVLTASLTATPQDNTVSISNIENINLNALAGVVAVDATKITGVKTLAFSGQGNLTLTGLQSTATLLRMNGTNGKLDASYAVAAVANANDTVVVDLVSTSTGAIAIDAGVETLRLTTTAGQTNTLTNVTGASVTTLQVTGGGALNVTGSAGDANGLPTTMATILATDTSAVNLVLAGSGTGTQVFTGNGADTVKFNGVLKAASLVSAGAGFDTLILGDASNEAATISGVDLIQFAKDGASLIMTNVTGGVALEFQNSGSIAVTNATSGTSVRTTDALSPGVATGKISVAYNNTVFNQFASIDLGRNVNASAPTDGTTLTNAATVSIVARATGAQQLGALTLDDNSAIGDVTRSVVLNAAGPGTQLSTGAIANGGAVSSLTLSASGAGSTVTTGAFAGATALQNLSVSAANGGAVLGAISGSTGLNSVTIDVGGAGLVAATAGTTDIVTASAGGVNTVTLTANGGNIGSAATDGDLSISNTAAGFGTVTISGTGNVFLTLATGMSSTTRVQTVNASGSTGALDLQITNTVSLGSAGTTATLGNASAGKVNFIDIFGNGADSVIGGTGTDNIFTAGGNDTITAGTGNDTVRGGLGGDTIALGGNGSGNDRVNYMIGGADNDVDAGVLLITGDRISGFGVTAGVDLDVIDLAGSLKAASPVGAVGATFGVDDVLLANMLSVANVNALEQSFANAQYDNKFVIELNDALVTNFNTQAGIDAAVAAITGRLGNATNTVGGTNLLFVFYDAILNANAAIFRYSEAAIATAGVQAAEISLVGIVSAVGASNLTDAHFA